MSDDLVLVTGGSGFVASHCILALLRAGYRVRTTLRSSRQEEVRDMLTVGGMPDIAADRLSFVQADLGSDAGWDEALEGCTYALHVASPFPDHPPRREEDLVSPARDGTLRVLRAADAAGLRRVVLTSSFAAIGFGHQRRDQAFTEETWSDLDGRPVSAYVKSKVLAERAAWEFVARAGSRLELVCINPVEIFGPLLGPDISTSILLLQRAMDGAVPGIPDLDIGAVDVRDVAELHILAMTHPGAAGQRFLASGTDSIPLDALCRLLRRRLGTAGGRIPTRRLPNWLVRLAALRDPAIRLILPELGRHKSASSAKARQFFGWQPRSAEEAVLATANSLMRFRLVRPA